MSLTSCRKCVVFVTASAGLELCLPTSVRKRSLPTSSGGLNLAHKRCGWSEAGRCFASGCEQTHLWILSPDPMRDQTVQPETEESWKKKRIFDFLSFKGASPSQRGHLKPRWCLTLLSAASSIFSFTRWVLISIARSAPKSQWNYCVSQNPGWNFQKDFTSDVVLQLLEPVWEFSSWASFFYLPPFRLIMLRMRNFTCGGRTVTPFTSVWFLIFATWGLWLLH